MTFRFDNLPDALSYLRVLTKPVVLHNLDAKPKRRYRRPTNGRELIAGGDPVRDPVDKLTAMVVAPAAWWAKPLPEPQKPISSEKPKPKKKKGTKMSDKHELAQVNAINRSRDNRGGFVVQRINGEDMINVAELESLIMQQIHKMPKEASPMVKQARESREIVDQLLHGICNSMEQFKADSRAHIETIRSTRYTVITETSQMVNALKDVRQFFMGADYNEQIARLRNFVELCEQLKNLKESGFLDAVADTIIKLDRPAA